MGARCGSGRASKAGEPGSVYGKGGLFRRGRFGLAANVGAGEGGQLGHHGCMARIVDKVVQFVGIGQSGNVTCGGGGKGADSSR